MKSIIIQAVTEQLGIDFRAALSSMFELFYNDRSRAFADHKPIAQFIKGPTGQFRRAFPLTHGLDKSECAKTQGTQRGFGATGDNHLGKVVADVSQRFAHGHSSTGATVRIRRANSTKTKLDCNIRMS